VRRGGAAARERERAEEHAAHRAVREPPAARVHEERRAAALRPNERPSLREPRAKRLFGLLAERHDPFLAALAERAQLPRREVHVLEVEPHQLRDAEPARVEELQERAVAAGERVLRVARGDDALRLTEGERARQRTLGLRARDGAGGIAREDALAHEE